MSETFAQFTQRLDGLTQGGLVRKIRPVVLRAALAGEALGKQNATTMLHVRTGRLRNSISGQVTEERDGKFILELSAGGQGGQGEVKYARIQEKGGVIVPKKGRMLAIPVGPARTAAGVSRYASPRDVPGLHLAMTRNRQLVLVQGQSGKQTGGKVKAGTVFFILVPSVRIPARPFLKPAADVIAKELTSAVQVILTEVLRGR
jgi:hypothetical protein